MVGAFRAPLQPPGGWCFIPASQGRRQGSENLRGLPITTQVWPVTRASEPDVCVLTRALGGSETHWNLRGVLGGKARPRLLPRPPPQAPPTDAGRGVPGA